MEHYGVLARDSGEGSKWARVGRKYFCTTYLELEFFNLTWNFIYWNIKLIITT